ncbi:MAG: hypothetical protein KC464_02695, partial [Myxococcales bacterium]|nr:hypothetical protein [Myxococcales bacterium]
MMRSSTVVLPRLVAAVTACVALAALAGCYGPSFDPCHVACAADSECPGGTACGSDLRCHVADQPICAVAGDAGVDGGDPDAALPVGSFKSLTVGVRFACGIDADDQLLCWGDNSSGQLGDGTFVSRAAAAPVTEPGPWKAVSAGSAHACGIKTSGALYCWGNDAWGQLTGVFGGWETSPIEVTTLPVGALWKAVAPGYAHTCAIRGDDGVMWCWGANFAGQLGTGQPEGVFMPAAITGHEAWAEVSSANLHTCARKDDGSAWCWGLGPLGQAGGDPSTSSDRPVEVAGGHTWRSLSTGLEHACGVTDGGELYCWGTDVAGEIGTTQADTPTPVVAEPGSDFETAFAGTHLSCATRSGGAPVCFGTNGDGQLGQGNRDDLRTAVTLPISAVVTSVGIGDTTACALDVDGVVWCWGRDDHGQAGDGHADARFVGTPVQGIAGTPVQLSSTNHHTCARTDDGRVFCWGANEAGQLGDGTDQDRATAIEVPRQNAMPWDWISAGWNHSCGVSQTRLYCWGADNYGQLGNGTSAGTQSPTRIAPTVTWSYVDASGFQTCALDDGGARWCWGDDSGD